MAVNKMEVRKRFFINLIAKKIKEDIIDKNSDLDIIKTVSIGDLDLMPSPETLQHRNTAKNFLPAIYILPENVHNTTVNANKSISSGLYSYTLRYVHYYDYEDTTDNVENAIDIAETIADTLLADNNMAELGTSYVTLSDNGKDIGHILNTDVTNIYFNTLDTQVFKTLKLPVIVIDIDYVVTFRSMLVKGVQ